VHAVNAIVIAADFASRGRTCPLRMTQGHEQPVADGQLTGNPCRLFAYVRCGLLAELAAQNASYERPAVLGLTGDVTRRRILAVDIGCGSGQRIAPPDAPV
jgi:hypothetical protein